jgi:ATP-binding cassette, subfamily B, bacterial
MSVTSAIRFRAIAERPEASSRPRLSRRVLEQTRACWPLLAGIVFLNLLATPLGLLLPVPLKIVVDSVAAGQPAPAWLRALVPDSSQDRTLWLAAGLLLAIGALLHLHSLATWILQTYTGEKLVLDFRLRLFWHAQRLSLRFHDHRGSSDTAYRIQHDAPAIQYVTMQGVVPLLTSAFAFAGMMYVTARLDWQLALLAVILSPVLFMLARSSSVRVHDRWHVVKDLDSKAMAVMDEALGSVRLVKAFGREQREDERFLMRSSHRMWSQVKLAWLQAGYHTAIGLTIAVGTAAALLLGVLHVRAGRLSLGELLLVMSYMAQVYDPLRIMSSKIPELQAWTVSLERAFKLLDEIPEALDCPGALPLQRAEGAIRFENVSFSYGPQQTVLRNVSLEIPAGTRVGIVGRTGCGKSTLVGLMARFYDVSSGRIVLDGVDLREYRLADLRQQFSVVLQDPVLFSTTIAENIAFTRPGASEDEIIAAATAAGAHEFIMRLPQEYHTEVGDRGDRLSGGQRQRIAVARAILKDAPILILDEPTSAVDTQTEAEMMLSTEALMYGRTTFLIAHRLSTLRDCDLLLRIEGGSVHVEPGARQAFRATESQDEELTPAATN